MTVKQCSLQCGPRWQVAWLPSDLAAKGKVLSLREGRLWTGPWRVRRVFSTPLESEYVRDHQRVRFPSLDGAPA